MNYIVLIVIAAGMLLLRLLKVGNLGWVAAWWIGCYILFKWGVRPPLPSSIIGMFMMITTVSLFFYFSSGSEKWNSITTPVFRFLTEPRYNKLLVVIMILIPIAVAFKIYRDMTVKVTPPYFGRTIHPAPPSEITFKGKTVSLANKENPFRALEKKDPPAFQTHVSRGREIYYQNCVFCHGDTMEGDGIYAHGFNPMPANFQDVGTLPQLQEAFLFWRIAKGGPGLPAESGPWASAMPAFENFLTEDDIWDVILFLYDFTNYRPRAIEIAENHNG